MVGRVGLGQEAVRGGARLVGEVEEGGGVVADHVGDGPALFGQLGSVDPVREVVRDVLLHEGRPVDAVGVPFQHERPSAQLGQHAPGDRAVVVREVGLGDAVIGEEHLVRAADRDGTAAGS